MAPEKASVVLFAVQFSGASIETLLVVVFNSFSISSLENKIQSLFSLLVSLG